DSLALHVVSGPRLSPDGALIAYTISDWDREKNQRVSHVYVVPVAGGAPLRLTNGERGESAPTWSPDSKRIAFLSNRDAASAQQPAERTGERAARGMQIWLISTAGGEAEKLTAGDSGVTAFEWSPDGKKIAYVARDVAKDKAEREKRRKDKFDAVVAEKERLHSPLWTTDI